MTLYNRLKPLKNIPPYNAENKDMASMPPRWKKRSQRGLFLSVLVLWVCSIIFYSTILNPFVKEYANVDSYEHQSSSNHNAEYYASSSTSDSETLTERSPSKIEKSSSRKQESEITVEDTSRNAKDCQLKLEEYLHPRIYQWVMDKVPIAVNVKVIKNQYHVIFNTGYIDPHLWYNAKYTCNDNIETATVMSATKPGQGNLIIQCPQSIQFNETALEAVSVVPIGGTKTLYEMEIFVECEKQDMKDYSPPYTSIGMCTSIAGKGRIREIAHEWVEFHRIIGVDHVWIYINSEWDDGKQPEKPYISWIPYNLNIKAYNFTDRPWTQRSEFFRVTSQVECVLRARRMGVDWVIFTDVDEYIKISDNETSVDDSELPPLKNFLHKYYNDDRNAIGGLVMNSIPFGNNLSEEKDPGNKLFIDHVLRNKKDPTDVPWSRWKQIVNPQNVHSYAIHWLGGGDVLKEIRLDANRVRINHYKEVNKGVGVFQTENASDLVKDTSLADKYHDQLTDALD